MERDATQQIIQSLNQDLEEKIVQMSQYRLVVETMSRDIHHTDYIQTVCAELGVIFNALITCVFWERKRAPAGWWLDAWEVRSEEFRPSLSLIPFENEGVLGDARSQRAPLYLEKLSGDEVLSSMWNAGRLDDVPAILFPLQASNKRSGMLVLIDPILKVTGPNIRRHLDLLATTINSGMHNHENYRDLRNSEEEVRDLFENASDMIIVAYPDGVIRDCNRALASTLHLNEDPRGEIIGDMISEEKGKVFEESWEKLLNGEDVRNVDLILKRGDGGLIEAELSGSVRPLPNGQPGVIRLYLRDLTERRRQEREQRRLEYEVEMAKQRQLAQVGLYVSGIAHNLQNPVQVLLGHIELMKQRGIEAPGLQEIQHSAERILDIIRNLMRKMQREQSTEVCDVDLNELLDAELTFLNANQFFKHHIEKEYRFDPELPPIRGVYSDFAQSIMNVVYNALDAMAESEKKTLCVQTRLDRERETVVVSISDTGPGIPDEVRDTLFQPFITTKAGDGLVDGLSGGSGLGLSSSSGLLQLYGGAIEYDTAPGEGTTFHLSIPLKPVREETK